MTEAQNAAADLFCEVFRLLPHVACVLNKESLTILFANRMFSELFVDDQQSVGLNFMSAILNKSGAVDFLDKLSTLKRDKLTNILVESVEIQSKTKNGNEHCQFIITNINETTILITGQPVDKIKKKEENSDLRKSELIECFLDAPIGLHCVDGNGILVYANQTMLDMLGYQPDEYIGHSAWEFCPTENVEMDKEVLQNLEKNVDAKNRPYRLLHKNGEYVPILADSNACFLADGAFSHTRCYIRNDEERLVQTAVLKERADKYRLMSVEKDRFVRITFHQIRTPLHALAASLNASSTSHRDAINNSSSSDSSHSNNSEFEDLKLQLDSCLGLVDDLAFATMFESDNVLQPRPVRMRLRREVEQVLRSVRHQQAVGRSAEQEVRFELVVDPRLPREVAVDRSVLRVLHNLVSNAVKFRAHGSAVTIRIDFDVLDVSQNSGMKNDLTSQSLSALPPRPPFSRATSSEHYKTHPRGAVKFTVSNQVDREMNLQHVHRRFQNYFMHNDSSVSTDQSSSSGSSSQRDSESSVSDLNTSQDRMIQQFAQSLTSNEGLGLGLFVSYNIVQSLGGLLECSASPEQASFWFTLEVEAIPDPVGGIDTVESQSDNKLSGEFSSLESPDERQSTDGQGFLETWSNVEHSDVGARHVVDDERSRSTTPTSSQTGAASAGKDTPDTRSTSSATRANHQVESKKLRVLIVDDSPICRKVLEKALQAQGYETDTACDGQEACDKLLFDPCLYNAVLMDLRMPIMDGLTATRICKERRHLANVPIIIVTAELGEEVRVAARVARATHFISKPAQIRELMEVLQKYLSCV